MHSVVIWQSLTVCLYWSQLLKVGIMQVVLAHIKRKQIGVTGESVY